MFATFVFVTVVLNVKFHVRAADHILDALVIGAALFGMLVVAAGTSGGCLNPAIGLVQ